MLSHYMLRHEKIRQCPDLSAGLTTGTLTFSLMHSSKKIETDHIHSTGSDCHPGWSQ